MLRTLSGLQAILLGVVVLLGVGLVGVAVFAVGSRQWFGSNALHVRAGFPDVQGVEVGTRCRIRGLDAGEVVALDVPEAIRRSGARCADIDGKDSPTWLRKNATVQIVSVGDARRQGHRGPSRNELTRNWRRGRRPGLRSRLPKSNRRRRTGQAQPWGGR